VSRPTEEGTNNAIPMVSPQPILFLNAIAVTPLTDFLADHTAFEGLGGKETG
jgi:hypothetical protein